jgi:hypothetical protein
VCIGCEWKGFVSIDASAWMDSEAPACGPINQSPHVQAQVVTHCLNLAQLTTLSTTPDFSTCGQNARVYYSCECMLNPTTGGVEVEPVL